MISRTEILDTLKGVYNKYDGIRLGLAGSYANNMATKNSDIDVVIDGDSMRMDIAEYIKSLFLLPVDILWLELLKEDDEEMDIDEFADYATRYASEIDCSITGKSMLALYERIEIMEEDGIPLTKANAEELIEEAADKAEKPSLGKLITGMFSSKYDKEGLLILREEHFI